MLEFLKASWDHLPPLPRKPRLPPGLLNLKARRAWLQVKPTFTYNDERDTIQRSNTRKAQRQLARDEAWARHAKRQQERADKKAKAQAAKAAKAGGAGAVKKGFQPLGTSTNLPPSSKPAVPKRAASTPMPRVANGWAAIDKSGRPTMARSPTLPGTSHTRVVYTTTVPVAHGHGGRSRPGMPTRQSTQAYRVAVPARPVRSATQPVPRMTTTAPKTTPAPRIVRSATQPTVRKR